MKVAVPELSVPVPMVVLLAEKVTVPVAALGATVAVKVTPAPAETEEFDAVSVVVLAVEPVPVPGSGSQKPLQPARASATIRDAAVIGRAGCTGLVTSVNILKLTFLYRVIFDARPLRCWHEEV